MVGRSIGGADAWTLPVIAIGAMASEPDVVTMLMNGGCVSGAGFGRTGLNSFSQVGPGLICGMSGCDVAAPSSVATQAAHTLPPPPVPE